MEHRSVALVYVVTKTLDAFNEKCFAVFDDAIFISFLHKNTNVFEPTSFVISILLAAVIQQLLWTRITSDIVIFEYHNSFIQYMSVFVQHTHWKQLKTKHFNVQMNGSGTAAVDMWKNKSRNLDISISIKMAFQQKITPIQEKNS